MKMKFFASILTFGFASANLPIYGNMQNSQMVDNIPVDSALGAKIMANARRLENNNEIDFTWVANFSIKFQGCHHVSQWNDAADEANDVRIQTKRLVRFRLCPTNTCSPSSSSGCHSGYGDYIIDLNSFLGSYYEAVDNYNQYRCQYTTQTLCSCTADDTAADDFNLEACEYECLKKHNMVDMCGATNPDENNQQQQQKFQLANYVQCQQFVYNAQNEQQGGGRQLQDGTQYFIGPYCAEQGGSIFLGMFTDDSCTTFADNYGGTSTYKSITGDSLPYAKKSVISMDCLSCKEPKEFNQDGNDAQDADQVSEMCEQIYETAGKCESSLVSSGTVSKANENACNYISGIKVVRKDGIITQVGSKANKTASIFIGIFVVAFVLLASYVYYLKTKLDRVSIDFSD